MNKIPETFLKYASDVLADTEKGLTGTQIVKYFSAKSVEDNIDIIHSDQPFKDKNDNNVNKRTAFFQNLSCFPPNVQYQIIIDLCERHNKEGFADLKKLTEERYGSHNSVASNETNKPQIISKIPKNEYETIISDQILVPSSNKIEKRKNMQLESKKFKPWYKQPQYFVPIVIAIISGLFLVWQANIQKEKPETNSVSAIRETFDLILIDHNTFKTPLFKIPNPKLKIYNSTPPTVIQIVDGTARFESDPKLLETPVLIEFENVSNYSIVDREHKLKVGKNEILVKKK